MKLKKIGNSIIQSRKNVDDLWLKFRDFESSRRELSNVYLLAKIGVDTAEYEPLEVWGKIIQYYSFVSFFTTRKTLIRPAREKMQANGTRLHYLQRTKVWHTFSGNNGFPSKDNKIR